MTYKNNDPFAPWNNPIGKNSPFKPWNNEMYKNDPFAPWNNPLSNKKDLERYENEHGLPHEHY